jgi:hypothetical protein
MTRAMKFLRPSLPLLEAGAAVVVAAEVEAGVAEVEEAEELVEAEVDQHLLHHKRLLLFALDHLAMLHPPFR